MGRPSEYLPSEHPRLGRALCLLGATDDEVARALDVGVRTIARWKKKHEEFRQALKEGKNHADAAIAQSLYHRARGFSHPAVHITANAKTGEHVTVPYTKHYPPSEVACIFWLKNRRPDLWRDKRDHEVTGKAADDSGATLKKLFDRLDEYADRE